MNKIKKIVLTGLAALLMPTSSFAAICVFADGGSTTCEIPLCVQQGFPTSSCRPALRVFLTRAFWGQSPIPFPGECLCEWVPPIVIATNQYGIPFFLEDSIPNLSELDPREYLSRVEVRDDIFSRALDARDNQTSYRTNCDRANLTGSFPNGSCSIETEVNQTNLTVQTRRWRSGGGIFSRGTLNVERNFTISSVSLDEFGNRVANTTNTTAIRILNNNIVSCQISVPGALPRNCGDSEFDLNAAVGAPDVWVAPDDSEEPFPEIFPGDFPGDFPGIFPGDPNAPNFQIQKTQKSNSAASKEPESEGIMVFK